MKKLITITAIMVLSSAAYSAECVGERVIPAPIVSIETSNNGEAWYKVTFKWVKEASVSAKGTIVEGVESVKESASEVTEVIEESWYNISLPEVDLSIDFPNLPWFSDDETEVVDK